MLIANVMTVIIANKMLVLSEMLRICVLVYTLYSSAVSESSG
jgi:hypothetical protein